MPISSKIEPIDRDLAVIFDEELSQEARSALLAQFAEEQINDVRDQNSQALGAVPSYDVFVDGRQGIPLTEVRPDGTIVAEFELLNEMLTWVGAQLVAHSPRKTGRYAASHVLFADGVEIDPSGPIPDAEEYAFVNMQPYSRKIEGGLSDQAPDGVYQAVTAVTNQRFGNIARALFGYRDTGNRGVRHLRVNDNMGSVERGARGRASGRNPAIIIRPGR